MKILHSLIIGSGDKNLIILHGFLGMGDNWKSHAKHWASQGWCVHLVDQRNHGRSFWSEIFDYSALVEDLKAYCDHHTLDNFILLGHSMGGKTAMSFAVLYPEIVSRLIVVDIGPKEYPPHHQQILEGLASLNFSIHKTRADVDSALAFFVPQEGVRQFLLKNLYWIEKGQLALRVNIDILKNSGAAIGDNLIPKQASYKGPTLFIRGTLSNYVLDDDHLILKHYFPNYILKDIPKSGHWLHAENPKFFLKVIEEWFLDNFSH